MSAPAPPEAPRAEKPRAATPRPPTRATLWRGRALLVGAAGAGALLVTLFGPSWLHGAARPVAAYDMAATVMLVATWTLFFRNDAARTASRSAVEDPGRNAMLAVVLVSVAVGLASAVSILGHGPRVTTPAEKGVVYGLAIAAVAVGWALIHTMYTFRYAHLYYADEDGRGGADRGLDFPGDEAPGDLDFAYFSFVLGMTFQVSDVEIRSSVIRRTALAHSLISFVYNTAILAFGINILSGLLH